MSSSSRSENRSKIKLVLAFDVGTTYSGISYSFLEPDQCPSIHTVTRFPGQENIPGASKVPSIIYYDKKGHLKEIGGEATRDGVHDVAIDGGWYKAEWFKLLLRSKYTSDMENSIGHNVPPLPPNKTVVDVFADYLRYLLGCAGAFIKGNHLNGRDLWISAKDDIHFVLSHPNGWEGKEQSQMRKAAVKARLVPDDPSGHSRISFVTEGEASLHFAIETGVLSKTTEGQGIVIVDAGGGTIDVSTYQRSADTRKPTFEEISVAECYFQGSVFVTFRAKSFLQGLLGTSSFAGDLDHICDRFDKTTKTRFCKASEPQFIKFGSRRDNDPSCGIRFGQLKLAGADVASFFQASIDCIVQAVMDRKKSGISHVVLVGGFAASNYLFEQVEALLTKEGLVLVRPDNRVNNAVSDGAISFYLSHYVRTRVAKVTYGVPVSRPYNELDQEHVKRSNSKIICEDGLPWIRGKFLTVLPKNTQVSETKEFVSEAVVWYSNDPGFSDQRHWRYVVMCYRGSQEIPTWIDTDPANFTTLCQVGIDLSQSPKIERRNLAGKIYYTIRCEVILIFGLTELHAQIRWFKDGVEHRSPAELIYDV